MRTPHSKHADRATVLTLAARAEIDPRTARRVLTDGPQAIRTEAIRERAARVLAEMGIAGDPQVA